MSFVRLETLPVRIDEIPLPLGRDRLPVRVSLSGRRVAPSPVRNLRILVWEVPGPF
jgi:hypothetical protein